MTTRAQCVASPLWHGKPTRCTTLTALRQSVIAVGADTPSGYRYVGSFPVCSKHKYLVETRGTKAVDPAELKAVPA